MSKLNNLAGWMRDVRALKDLGGEAYDNFLDLFGALVDDCEAGCDEGDGGSPADGDTPEVDSRQLPLRPQGDARSSRPAARGGDVGTPASVLDRALDGLAGPERVEAQRELDLLRMHSMGASQRRNVSKGVRCGEFPTTT